MSSAQAQPRSKAPWPGLEPMLTLHITNATCTSHLVIPSKQYRLGISAEPDVLMGLKSSKSKYIKDHSGTKTWKDPFEGQFSIPSSSSNHKVTISLFQRHFGYSGYFVGSCVLDTSFEGGTTELALLSSSDEEIGHLMLSVAVTSTSTVLTDATRNADALGTPHVFQPLQISLQEVAAAPFVLAVAANPDAEKQLLERLDTLIKWDDTTAQIRPHARLTWGVLSVVSKVISAQNALDDRIKVLLVAMNDSCSFVDDPGELKGCLEQFHAIIYQILEQVMECGYFIRDYCEDTAFATRRIKDLGYTVEARINEYEANFATLQRALINGAAIQSTAISSRVHLLDIMINERDLDLLKDMEYAREAHLNLSTGCLPGTRTEIIDAIFYWGLGADVPPSTPNNSMTLPYRRTSRVLWLCGAMGTGKTSILRSSAARMKNMGCRRVYYGFDKNQPKASIACLFSTIARDLADLDPAGRGRLVELLKGKAEIRTTSDCELQFQHFIIDTAVGATNTGETVIFIDAFDESGNVKERRRLLHILTQRASELPNGLRIVITSRDERDVLDALETPLPSVDVMRMQNIAEALTFRDIDKYAKFSLRNVKELKEDKYSTSIDTLVGKAGTSFQWAAHACHLITSNYIGNIDRGERVSNILMSDHGLDAAYTAIMNQSFDRSDASSIARLKSVLSRILCAHEPLTLGALARLLPPTSIFSNNRSDFFVQQRIVRSLGSLLNGTHDDNTPIIPLHASFREFLYDSTRSGVFFVDEKEAHEVMALACLRVMRTELKFNICRIPASFLLNCKIPNIEGRVHEHISLPLSYASRNWSLHVSKMPCMDIVVGLLMLFFQESFLKWLEVMSLTQTDPHHVLTALTNVELCSELVATKEAGVQFISMFGQAISESVPHIYLSAMTFIPDSSPLYHSQHALFPGIVKLLNGQLNSWVSFRVTSN